MLNLEQKFFEGDTRALSKMLSAVEREDSMAFDFIKKNNDKTGSAYVIGITGQPGAGKSTLTNVLTTRVLKENASVAIIAVDPSSPFSGGAILGDRIRMTDHYTSENTFIRSMGTRGSLGGLSTSVRGAIKVFDIFGFDYIIVETVGVGQSEVDIARTCDTTCLVLVPGAGDDIQAIKAGIMEIGDVFVVNKADNDGADNVVRQVKGMLELKGDQNYYPPVVKVVSTKGEGIDELFEAINEHRKFMSEESRFDLRRESNQEIELIDLLRENFIKSIINKNNYANLSNVVKKINKKQIDVYTASEQILKEFKKGE
jgi:LAO/AO transport system kinase